MSRSSRSRPTNGVSSPSERRRPPTPAVTRNARQSRTCSDLPFSSKEPASSYTTAASLARRVESPTSTVPGSAADWTREAVLTRSPATRPWPVAPSVTAASPVRTPARARSPASSAATASTSSRAARTARSDVVLARRGSAPDRHHRVADELLDRSAVAADDEARGVEVAREQVADVLRVARLGERGEADEVGEEDGDDAPLDVGRRSLDGDERR